MEAGRIVVLNGPSSAGKSTTAAAFQALMSGPWWHTGMDALGAMLPSDEGKRAGCGTDRFVTALHRFVADLARQGHDVVYDTGFLERGWVDDFRRETAGLRVFPVELTLSREALRERERGRADRPEGYAEGQFGRVLRPFPDALWVDAEALGPEERARAIARFVEEDRRAGTTGPLARDTLGPTRAP